MKKKMIKNNNEDPKKMIKNNLSNKIQTRYFIKSKLTEQMHCFELKTKSFTSIKNKE